MSYIRFQDVSKSFNGTPVVKSVSFTIEKGEVCGFVGRNGSGKTVIFKLMTGLLVPDKGSVTFDGVNLTKQNRFFESLGVMIETPGFIPHYSGLKNLKILNAMSVNPVPAEEICALMTRLGLNPKNRKSVRTYSLGMRQKLGIIQAVMNKPELLVLDEPGSNLDPLMRDRLCDRFREYLDEGDGEKTILFSTHNISDMEYAADYVIFMAKGKIVEKGFVEDLKEKYIIVRDDIATYESNKPYLLTKSKNATVYSGLALAENRGAVEAVGAAAEIPTLQQLSIEILKLYEGK